MYVIYTPYVYYISIFLQKYIECMYISVDMYHIAFLYIFISLSLLHEVLPPNGGCLGMVEMNTGMESELLNHSSK